LPWPQEQSHSFLFYHGSTLLCAAALFTQFLVFQAGPSLSSTVASLLPRVLVSIPTRTVKKSYPCPKSTPSACG
jgi:hypothetical protein